MWMYMYILVVTMDTVRLDTDIPTGVSEPTGDIVEVIAGNVIGL